ncbi:ABC transporter permease [Kosmotoga pacifica]|uniref:Transport permease protein n=1 Tax=Kosmotoga pacifica TaxID=1330330 RepID=A0A0G2ZDB4_9BACT|nr:ABC transporter permease [Kosmotoga pacifica]AKI97554.1 hypothetical protein IX53_06690 [Kosmotoga pacifica]
MNKLKQLWRVFIAFLKESFRNRVEFFFGLMLPVLFLVMFGYIFGGEENVSSLKVGLFSSDSESISWITDVGGFEFITFASTESMMKALNNIEIGLALQLSSGELTFYKVQGNPSLEGEIAIAQSAIVAAIEAHLNDVEPVITVKKTAVSSGIFMATGSDYIMSGVIGISILSSGMFAVISLFGRYRKKGILDRFRATPMDPIIFVLGSTFTRFLMSLFSVVVIMFINRILFNSKIRPDWLPLIVVIICSTLGMMALGLLLVLIFKEPQSAQSAGDVLFFLMTFASGIYFPIAFLPEFLKKVSLVLPVTHTVRLIRSTMGIIEVNRLEFLSVNIIFAVVGMLLLITVSRLFLRAR